MKAPILVTGFGPFEAVRENPSATLALALAEAADVRAEILPVAWDALDGFVETTLANEWRGVVLLGVAAERDVLSLERVALNFRDVEREDARGALAPSERVVDGAPDAYFSTLPLRAARDALARAGVEARESLSAGAYLCNALFFRARHALEGRGIPCGFVHVPPVPGLVAGRDGVPLARQRAALEALLDVVRRSTSQGGGS